MTPEERTQEILRLEGPRIARLVRAAAKLVKAPLPVAGKRAQILEIADGLSRTIVPHTPCARGCSDCCSWPLSITAFEARLIGRQVGREPKRLGRRLGTEEAGPPGESKARHYGIPCPFLKPGGQGCSVYPVRPLACRLHHSVADDESNCRLRLDEQGRPANRAPALDLSEVGGYSYRIFVGEDFGDIREFFPPEA